MRRKFTVYGLRFSKTSFWNRMNTGFLDPAVATVPTACGIETNEFMIVSKPFIVSCNSTYRLRYWNGIFMKNVYNKQHVLQQYLPLAVLKQLIYSIARFNSMIGLQQYLPLAVLKLNDSDLMEKICHKLQQYLPLAVLKRHWRRRICVVPIYLVATVPTACGIETLEWRVWIMDIKFSCNSTYRLRYWNYIIFE